MEQLFSSAGHGLQIGLDWLGFTFDSLEISHAMEFLNFSSADFQYFDSGAYGYRKRLRHRMQGISLLYDGHAGMGVHLEVSGTSLFNFLQDFIAGHSFLSPFGDALDLTDYNDLLSWFFGVMNRKGHFSRIDLAVDDVGQKYYSMLDLHRFNESGMYLTKSRQWKEIIETAAPVDFTPGEITGYTIYIGSRQSDTFLRIYDKRLEQNKKLKARGMPEIKEKWVRWELEIKGDNARNLALLFSSGKKDLRSVTLGILANYIRFVIPDNSRKSRCSTDSVWASFLGGMESCRIGAGRRLLDDIELREQWLMRSCSRTVYEVFDAHGGDIEFLQRLLEMGQCRSGASM